ncbi:hypothetical protein TCAL_00097 [Tigriopus californicus]|uniref:Reelin domain-containing protein n=1 Tax=Tigriopus californicus TaxID=6832 RepID=A0A553PFS3_TIGCA|nr:putative defense protein Hdd11 [Tigriopus californicus]XP_059083196.1 putative defense protein Hdd11 [Tigriopus californicus]TRY76535.1 hypothetical protein TCAL_00097 [Tigriopus californicus]
MLLIPDNLLLATNIILGWVLPGAMPYSRGAPVSQCEYMTPKHGFQPQITKAFPTFEVGTTRNTPPKIRSDESILIKLKSSLGIFRGFMIKAEEAETSRIAPGLGTWWVNSSFPGVSYLNCGQRLQNTLTHNQETFSHTEVVADWQPPLNFSGEVRFRATVVEDYKTFWKNIVSETLTVKRASSQQIRVVSLEENQMLERLDRRPRQQRQEERLQEREKDPNSVDTHQFRFLEHEIHVKPPPNQIPSGNGNSKFRNLDRNPRSGASKGLEGHFWSISMLLFKLILM